MAILGSQSSIFTLKAALVSASVLAAAVALWVATPGLAELLSVEVPRMYGSLRAWLTPPYLYFVINGIIISIAASSRFQKSAAAADITDSAGSALPPPSLAVVRMEFPPPVECVEKVDEEVLPEFAAVTEYGGVLTVVQAAEEVEAEGEEEFVISRSSWSPKRRESREISTEYSAEPEKPLVSVRFGHRKSVKASPDAAGKALRVARPKRNGTLESTWKAITDGRAVPLARHLKKSDTWGDVHGRGRDDDSAEPEAEAAQPMRKSETLNGRGGRPPPAGLSPSPVAGRLKKEPSPVAGRLKKEPSSVAGRLKKEPSLGQDDLNRRVEAFIKKFNDEMRLQRQESFLHYMDMINRGSG